VTEIASVEVTVWVPASPPDVFGFFTDPARYVQWMGSEADLEPVPGGVYRVRMADGFSAAGRFVEVAFPRLVVFTWGFADDEAASRTKRGEAGAGGEPGGAGAMPGGSTRVTVTFREADGGTLLTRLQPAFPLSVVHGTTTMSHRRCPDHYRVTSSWLSLASGVA
jgi:uncharacterized protein YndB with AHSA1/START domain